MSVAHPSHNHNNRIDDGVILHVTKQSALRSVFVIVVVVRHRLSIVCPLDPVHKNTTVGARFIRIYTNFTVHVVEVFYGLNFGSNCRKLGPVL